MTRMPGFFDRGYNSRHGGEIVKHGERNVDANLLPDPDRNSRNSQRLTSEIKKIVCERNRINMQGVPPDIRYRSWRSAQYPGARRIVTAASRVLKRIPVDFAGRGLRHPVYPDEDCRRGIHRLGGQVAAQRVGEAGGVIDVI